jgi:hypothetical protein
MIGMGGVAEVSGDANAPVMYGRGWRDTDPDAPETAGRRTLAPSSYKPRKSS